MDRPLHAHQVVAIPQRLSLPTRYGSKEKGEWYKEAKNKPLTMYVMVETFDADKPPTLPKPGAKRVQKGFEVWTQDTTAGKEMAEKMLTVVGMTHREVEPFFSPIISRSPVSSA